MAARVRATDPALKENAMNRLKTVLYTAQKPARLGSLEELVWLYDQTSPFHFVMGATFIGAGTAPPWREVLGALQRRHPLLRVRIEHGACGFPEFVTDEARIRLRIGVIPYATRARDIELSAKWGPAL